MLPSMPIISTPSKEGLENSVNNESQEVDTNSAITVIEKTELMKDDTNEHFINKLSSINGPKPKPMDATTTTVSFSSKKCSPLKHVTPILKKYSSQRKVLGNKKLALLAKGLLTEKLFEKPSLRPIAPKPVMVLITPQSQILSENKDNIVMAKAENIDPVLKEGASSNSKDKYEITDVEIGLASSKSDKQESSEKTTVCEKKDNEEEIAALMLASTNVRVLPKTKAPMTRKKKKQLKDMQTTLHILSEEEDATAKDEKAFTFAQAYFSKVKERLESKEEEVYKTFMATMIEFSQSESSAAELYQRVTALLSHHTDLADEFLAFLLPEQAMQCGKFMEHLMITKMKDFCRKLEVYFAKTPHQIKKIYSSLSILSNQTNVTLDDVRSAILPLLKGIPYLIDTFIELLPQCQPPDSLMTEFEYLDCYEDSDDEKEIYETVDMPEEPDPYGGDNCICVCHNSTDEKYRTRALHCIPCGTKYIHGKVYVQTGKGLRAAKIMFTGGTNEANMRRLSVKECPRVRRRRRTRGDGTSKFSSPNKHALLSPLTNSNKETEEVASIDNTVSVIPKATSPKSARAKSRSLHVGNKTREKVSTKSITSSKSSPNEKKDGSVCAAKTDGTKTGSKESRQVATVRLCRISTTSVNSATSYAVVPATAASSKGLVKSSVPKAVASSVCSENLSPPPIQDNLKKNILLDLTTTTSLNSLSKKDSPSPQIVVHQDESALLPPDSTKAQSKITDFSSLTTVLKSDSFQHTKENSDSNSNAMDTSDFQASLSEDDVVKPHPMDFLYLEMNDNCDSTTSALDITEASLESEKSMDVVPVIIDESKCTEAVIGGNMDISQSSYNMETEEHSLKRSSKNKETCTEKTVPISWTREEDKVILQIFQSESTMEQALVKIGQQLPSRSIDQIHARFQILMNLLQQMTGVKMEEESNNVAH